jgi:hypothetical protein
VAVNKAHQSEAETLFARNHATQNCLPGPRPAAAKCQAQKTGCKDWLGRIRPDATCVVRVCTPLFEKDICQRAVADLVMLFRSTPNHCQTDSDCDALWVNSCDPPFILPTRAIKPMLDSDGYKSARRAVDEHCSAIWS